MLALMLLRLYNAPLPLIETLKLAMIRFGLNTLTRLQYILYIDTVLSSDFVVIFTTYLVYLS